MRIYKFLIFIAFLVPSCSSDFDHDRLLYQKLDIKYATYTESDGGMFPNQHIMFVVNILTANENIVTDYSSPPVYFYKKTPYTGDVVSFYNNTSFDAKNKILYFSGQMKKGHQVGEWLVYDREGRLIRKVQFNEKGEIFGKYIYCRYYEKGISSDTLNIEYPIYDGRVVWYDIPKKHESDYGF